MLYDDEHDYNDKNYVFWFVVLFKVLIMVVDDGTLMMELLLVSCNGNRADFAALMIRFQ